MRKGVAIVGMLMSILGAAVAQEKTFSTWTEVADDMGGVLDRAYALYVQGKAKEARDEVNVAYYGYYEKIGFERVVKARISGNRAGVVELQFSRVKKDINSGKSAADVKASIETLNRMLHEDAALLDPQGTGGASWGTFVASLLIILREGFEAILIVGAIIAYLIKSGNKDKLMPVYVGSVVAIFASILMAIILNLLAGVNGGKSQEFIEAMTMFVAVAVLFYVSNWMLSKAETTAWSQYIEGKVQSSVDRGSMFSLAFTAFLAVFRDGAEIILFYQALIVGASSASDMTMIWLGLGIGVVLLVFVYLAIRFLSVKLPLKPFFTGTSILMFIMCISFVGNGVQELIEGDFITPIHLDGWPTVSILGIFPTVQTVVPQLILLVITVVTLVMQVRHWQKSRAIAASKNGSGQ